MKSLEKKKEVLSRNIIDREKLDKEYNDKEIEILYHLYSFMEIFIPGKKLCYLYNVKPLALRKMIQKFRNDKIIIIASVRGYRFTQHITSIDKYIENRRKELRQESITINCMKNALNSLKNAISGEIRENGTGSN